ncbi:acyl-CoA dehydrogenase family protein, partial [Chloroflexota bacterium]
AKLREYMYEGHFPISSRPDHKEGGTSLSEEAVDLHKRFRGVLEVRSKLHTIDHYLFNAFCLPPGSADPSRQILEDITRVYDYTAKGNLVAVVSDGSAVLGFGNIGARAALPVMEGKSILFNTFAGVEAFPICLSTQAPDEIVEIVQAFAPSFGDGTESQGEIGLFLVEARSPGIECTVLETLGLDKQCEVVFNEVKVRDGMVLGRAEKAGDALETVLEQAAVGKCADMVGSARAAFESAVSYARQRIQYGHPIGSFQAIQHHCANMAVDIDGAALITYEAAWSIDKGLPSARLVSMAKSWVNEACQRVTLLGHQIYGGIGFCRDQDMHLYYRRVRAGGLTFGDTVFHRKVVARELLQGAPAFSRG